MPAEEDAVAIGDRRIIDGNEIERETAGGVSSSIADQVLETDGTADVFVGHETIPPPRKGVDASIQRIGPQRHKPDGIPIGIAVISKKVSGSKYHRNIFTSGDAIGFRGRLTVR